MTDAGIDGEVAAGTDRRRVAPFAAAAVGLVLLVLVVVLARSKPADERAIQSQLVGRAVPQVSGTTIDGTRFDIDKQRGKFVVVNFFATWCTPCRVEHPELVKFSQEHAATGDAIVVSVAFNDSEQDIRQFFAKFGGTWPVIPGDTGRTILDFGVTGVPESYVVAPSGQVVAKFEGVTSDALDRVMADVGSAGGQPPGSAGAASGGTGR